MIDYCNIRVYEYTNIYSYSTRFQLNVVKLDEINFFNQF